jgi:PAS domain-containing protein
MISPVSDEPGEPAGGSPTLAERRRKIARKWAHTVSLTAYLPMPHNEIERQLLELTNGLFDAVTCEPLPTDRVAAIGARLVEMHCVGKASLQCTVDVLAAGLLAEPELRRLDRLPERVAQLLGALASGFVEATRFSTLEQQDNLHRALLEAMWVSERRLQTSTVWLDEVLKCSPNGIAITDLDGRFVRVNPAFDGMLARSAGDTLFELIPDLRDAYQGLLDGKTGRVELAHPTDSKMSLIAALLRDPDGMPGNYLTIVTPMPM